VAPHLLERAEEGAAKFSRRLEETIMRRVLACVVPDTLLSVKFGPVGWQLKDFQVAQMLGKVVIGLLFLVIGGIILNEINAVTSPIKRGQEYLIDESQIRLPREIIFLMEIGELGVVQPNGSKDLLGIALSTCGNLRLVAPSRPGGMKSGRLAEGGLVFENDHRPFVFGVFFRLG